MPQPLKPPYSYRYGDVLGERPELAVLVLRVISFWSLIDQKMNSLLSALLKSQYRLSMVMLQTVDSQSLRRTIIRKIASEVLSRDDCGLLSTVFKIVASSERRRNEFAHHIWAVNQNRPDTLILINPKDINLLEAALRDHAPPKDADFDFQIPEFTKPDLEEEVERAKFASVLVVQFVSLVEYGAHADPRIRARCDSIRAELLAVPQVRKAFDNLSGKNSQEPPQE